MTIKENKKKLEEISSILSAVIPMKFGINKQNELLRLIYEISFREGIAPEKVLDNISIKDIIDKGNNGLFHRIKKELVSIRYPSKVMSSNPHLMPVSLEGAQDECTHWDDILNPENIYVEKDVKALEWTKNIIKLFPHANISVIDSIKSVSQAKGCSVETYNSRLKDLFLVRTKVSLIKMCPCTKDCVRCGYWILNIGFGCPIDCSYCYLQQYSNSPGMLLTANIEDYGEQIKNFDKSINKKIRIGTGEFTDSLAFDKYTGYSSYLIPRFKHLNNLVLELKTKTSELDNVLKEEPNDNVVISWSINTRNMAEKYEKGGASVSERIKAAERAAKYGYKIGFHFDPLVYHEGWEEDYEDIIKELFSREVIQKNTVWISLGTLRYTPGLKQAAEKRFDDNLIFYEGEFFEDFDGKMRYTSDRRVQIYNSVIERINKEAPGVWIYLCMETDDIWKKTSLDKRQYQVM